jgi:hypothetical protein
VPYGEVPEKLAGPDGSTNLHREETNTKREQQSKHSILAHLPRLALLARDVPLPVECKQGADGVLRCTRAYRQLRHRTEGAEGLTLGGRGDGNVLDSCYLHVIEELII